MRFKALGAVAVLGLAGCAGQGAAGGPWNHWVCDSQADVFWRPVGQADQVEVRLAANEPARVLQQEPAGSGALYSDGQLSLHVRGDEGLVYWTVTDDLIGRGCKAR